MRKLKDGVLKNFVLYCENTEIPSLFSLWVGMSLVSSTLGRDCFIDQGHFVVYPNLYIVLVAGSAKCRKSTAIEIGRNAISKVRPRIQILSQKMTPEALIQALSGIVSKDETTLLSEAEGIIVVDELSTLIDRNAFKTGMISLLTKLFDCRDFDYRTRGRGIEVVRNPCLSLLGASTTQWIKEAIPAVAIGGGFTSRIIFVFRDSYEHLVPWVKMTDDNVRRGENIVHDLNEIAKMRGGFALHDDAISAYETEYRMFMENSQLFADPNVAGYAGRRHSMLLKTAMIVSASVKDDRVITYDDIMIARNALDMVEKDMPRVLQAIRTEVVGDVCEEVLGIIMNQRVIPRSELVRKMRYRLSARELDVILETLEEIGVVKTEVEGGRTKYVYVGDKK